MNIAWFFGFLIIVLGKASDIERSNNNGEIGQWTLLRKLQSFQNAPKDDAKSVTWNDILAEELIKKIGIYPFDSSEESLKKKIAEGNFLKESLSQMLVIYKIVYDKFVTNEVANYKTIDNRKEEVEVIEAGREKESCEGCGDVEAGGNLGSPCIKGQKTNEGGACDEKQAKLILAVPKQCPIGYKADRLGYCRVIF
ncbi:unnamed protein product [Chilo suppressalis]|uniref:Uncharacterized protein n=1 Tax=Chilo suppressalis TaxID=168631 RepID=A0ABN8AYW7_CHISP|nr:unnamed protein product [Chilo suppressalis]